MIVEKGVPRHDTAHDDLDSGVLASVGVGKNAGQRQAGLPGAEACSDEDDDEDDIHRRRLFTSCHELMSSLASVCFSMSCAWGKCG